MTTAAQPPGNWQDWLTAQLAFREVMDPTLPKPLH